MSALAYADTMNRGSARYDIRRSGLNPTDAPRGARYHQTSPDYVTHFHALKAAWERETALSSSLDDMVESPSMQAIIAMGEIAVPLIIRDLMDERSFLYLALPEILGEDPIPDALNGHPEEIADVWIDWARRNGVVTG